MVVFNFQDCHKHVVTNHQSFANASGKNVHGNASRMNILGSILQEASIRRERYFGTLADRRVAILTKTTIEGKRQSGEIFRLHETLATPLDILA